MLLTKTDSAKYISEFKDRFANFAQKAPILLSFIVSDREVKVIHENSGTSYSFEWDFGTPVKGFIHEIKQVLSDNHYPRLAKVITSHVPLTADEQATLLATGTSVDALPTTREMKETIVYRIDKVIALKDRFVLQDERTFKTYLYKLNYSSIFFLKNYRSKKYETIESAGDFFFARALMLNELLPRE